MTKPISKLAPSLLQDYDKLPRILKPPEKSNRYKIIMQADYKNRAPLKPTIWEGATSISYKPVEKKFTSICSQARINTPPIKPDVFHDVIKVDPVREELLNKLSLIKVKKCVPLQHNRILHEAKVANSLMERLQSNTTMPWPGLDPKLLKTKATPIQNTESTATLIEETRAETPLEKVFELLDEFTGKRVLAMYDDDFEEMKRIDMFERTPPVFSFMLTGHTIASKKKKEEKKEEKEKSLSEKIKKVYGDNVQAGILTDLLAHVYPAYMSLKSIECDKDKSNYKQWLSYWVIYGMLELVENFNEALMKMSPFYYTLKTAVVFWLMLPRTQGALFLYNTIMKLWIPNFDRIAKVFSEKKKEEPKKQEPSTEVRLNQSKIGSGGKGTKLKYF
ncbi:ER membrane protein DP1/Yop1 [Terramyces sp. JEL0728]|nr:ER membrane protein DP1/Yop1 [Terramyces sp. JEL0728]